MANGGGKLDKKFSMEKQHKNESSPHETQMSWFCPHFYQKAL